MALAETGCTVKAICPEDHPLRKTSAIEESYPYRGLAPLACFVDAIGRGKPDFVIPGDDLAAQHLRQLHRREQSKGGNKHICALIERSIGPAESFPFLFCRSKFINLAEEQGIRVPKTKAIANIDELREWISGAAFPMVLKADGTSGGEGVRVVRTPQEAERAFRKLQAPPIVARVVKRVLLDRDTTLVWPMLSRHRSAVNAQAFVAGREATSLVACWKGTVLAALHFEVLNKQDANGPASVVRLIEDADMVAAAEKMVRRLNLSGLHGFDFMMEAQTGKAYLIEINPRPTQVGHLRLGPGRDLPAALRGAVSGGSVLESSRMTDNDTIAFFPQEWQRNPESIFLRSAYHDVPWQEPELLRVCARKQRKWSAWFSQRKGRQVFLEARLPRS